jgi:hypothetical protein
VYVGPPAPTLTKLSKCARYRILKRLLPWSYGFFARNDANCEENSCNLSWFTCNAIDTQQKSMVCCELEAIQSKWWLQWCFDYQGSQKSSKHFPKVQYDLKLFPEKAVVIPRGSAGIFSGILWQTRVTLKELKMFALGHLLWKLLSVIDWLGAFLIKLSNPAAICCRFNNRIPGWRLYISVSHTYNYWMCSLGILESCLILKINSES